MTEPDPTEPVVFELAATATADMIDELGHVSNIAYLTWIQQVATAHCAAVGFDREGFERLGGIWMVRKHALEYLQPAYLGDEVVLASHIVDFRGASAERKTEIRRAADDVVLCQASTLWVYVSIQSRRATRIPKEIVQAFARS